MQKIIRLSFLFFAFVPLFAQTNNQNLTLAETDQLLIKNNLSLLAAKYNVNIAESQKIQAKLFDNPDLALTIPAYSKEHGWFDVVGDVDVSLMQAIKIAGKRKAGIDLAESQKQLAVWQYELLAKQLKYAVHSSYFTIYYLQKSIDKTSTETIKLKTIINALQVQYNKGNVTLNEFIRITASYNSLSSDILELQNSIHQEKNNLRTLLLLSSESDFTPTPTFSELNKYSLSLTSLPDIIQKAEAQHPEIKLADASVYASEMQLKYEKKQAIPDLQFGVGYSKDGDYTKYLTYANFGVSIPIFNRNQGNIKAAEYQVKQSQVARDNQKNILESQIKYSYDRVKAIEARTSDIGSDFESQFDLLMTNVSENYMKRNLSMLEFTDLIESYHEQIVQLNNLKLEKILSYEDLNYNTGYNLF